MFDIVGFFTKFFNRDKPSGSIAKDRLKLVLVSDRISISPHLMNTLKEELIEVISRYMTIDTTQVEVGVERKEGSMALAANIPILDMKRGSTKKSGSNGGSSRSAGAAREALPVRTAKLAPKIMAQSPVQVLESDEAKAPPADTGEINLQKKSRKSTRRYQAKARGRTLRKRAAI